MLQEVVLKQFYKKYKKPTYKEMVEITGIEQTRLFRIKNGSHMRVDELEKFLIHLEKDGLGLNLFFDCYQFLDLDTIEELERCIRRKVTLAKLRKEI